MKSAIRIAGVVGAATLALGLASAPAHAAAGTVNGTVTVGAIECGWSNAVTSDQPPNTLVVDHTTIDANCSGGIPVTIPESPTVTFDDTAGTATVAGMNVTASVLGMECGYSVDDMTVARDGTTRSYNGSGFTATKISGGFLCPGTQDVDSVNFTFQ